MRRIISVLVLSLAFVCIARAQDADSLKCESQPSAVNPETVNAELWNQGNQAYVSGNYASAKECYRKILDSGEYSVKLYNNLGSACFKTGNIGEAVLYLRRALIISPSNEDIRFNLQMVESQTKDKIAEVPEAFFVRWARSAKHFMSCLGWSICSLVFLALFLAGFLAYLLSERLNLRKAGFYSSAVALLCFLVSLLFAVSSGHDITDRYEAVVMASAISAKSTPDRSSKDLFVIHEGTVVTLANRVDEWNEIVLADGKKGWVESKSIEVI